MVNISERPWRRVGVDCLGAFGRVASEFDTGESKEGSADCNLLLRVKASADSVADRAERSELEPPKALWWSRRGIQRLRILALMKR